MNRHDPLMMDFDHLMLPHLDAAYRLAAWLTHDDMAAQDIVQDSYLRAFKAWRRFEAGNAKAWLLTIVRRQAFSWLARRRSHADVDLDDEANVLSSADLSRLSHDAMQESGLITSQTVETVRKAIVRLPASYRVVVVLRDIEGLSYSDLAQVLELPVGTVMSRLSRGRDRLREILIRDGYAHGS